MSSDSWFLSGTDEYEASDPVWVSGKFLMTYVLFKQRVVFGRTIFSPSVIMGNYSFRSSYPEFGSVLGFLNSSVATLDGTFFAKASVKEPERSYYTIRGIPGKVALLMLTTTYEPR